MYNDIKSNSQLYTTNSEKDGCKVHSSGCYLEKDMNTDVLDKWWPYVCVWDAGQRA